MDTFVVVEVDIFTYEEARLLIGADFRAIDMGITPSEYITDCRLEWAKNSLAYSDLSVAEITEAIGYEHRNGFAIAFKKKYGYTPSEYRKKIKRESEYPIEEK